MHHREQIESREMHMSMYTASCNECIVFLLKLVSHCPPDKPYITQFASDPLSTENNLTIWCVADGNPAPVITIFNMSDELSHLARVPGVTKVKYRIHGTTLSCLARVELKCLAENVNGVAEQTTTWTIGCELFKCVSNCLAKPTLLKLMCWKLISNGIFILYTAVVC